MESGKHRMSLKLMTGTADYMDHFFGLVRDGAAWDKEHHHRASTDAWYMYNMGSGGGFSMVMGNSTMTMLAVSRKAKS